MQLTAYNLNDIQSRNLLTKVSRNDMNVVKDFPCVGRVHIEATNFREEFKGGGELHEPYLELLGEVDSFFIEAGDASNPDKPEVFPCGTTELSATTSTKVRFRWYLTCEEKADLYARGLGTPGFEPPAIFKNNVIELPLKINFVGIYDTPVCFVEVSDPQNLSTSTFENHYVDMWKLCEPSAEALAQKERAGQIEYITENEYALSQESETTYLGEPTYDDVVEAQSEETEEVVDRTTEAIRKSTENAIKSVNDEYENRSSSFDSESFLRGAQEQANEKAAKDNQFAARDMYGNLMTQENAGNAKLTYDDIHDYAKQKQEEEKREAARKVDRAADLAAMNAGITDIAGMGASTDVTAATKVKSEANAKKERQAARNADIVSDLAAFNSGSTDVAGQGSAATKAQPKSAQALLAGLFPNKNKPKQAPDMGVQQTQNQPQQDGQQFL